MMSIAPSCLQAAFHITCMSLLSSALQTQASKALDSSALPPLSRNSSKTFASPMTTFVKLCALCDSSAAKYFQFHSLLLLDSLHAQVVKPELGDTLCKQHSLTIAVVPILSVTVTATATGTVTATVRQFTCFVMHMLLSCGS